MKTPGYVGLHASAALIDLSSRGRVRVTGEDRARLLHAMTTNHVQELKPGQGLYAFFLDAQGRILLDANLFCFDEHFLIDVEPERREFLVEHLDRYIIADDVTVEDITSDTWCLAVEGPQAVAPIELGSAYSHGEWNGFTVAAVSYTGAPGYRIFGRGERPDLKLPLCDLACADAVRLEHFKPRYGTDFGDKTIPQETQQMQAVHFQKGCYIGQEIVERVRARGKVIRLLMGFEIDAEVEVPPGTKVIADGKESGEVSSAGIGVTGNTIGLAIVRVPAAAPGNTVEIAGRAATLRNPY